MRKIAITISLLLLGFASGYIAREATDEFWDIDRCQDWGGMWDEERYTCVYDLP